MDNKIKIGAVSWGLPGAGFFAAEVAAKAGLDGIQLELGSYKMGYPLSQPEIINGYLQVAEQYSLEYPSIVLNDVMVHEYINGRSTENGKIAYEQIVIGIETARALNIKSVMLPNFEKNLIESEKHIDNTVEALIHACDFADIFGISIFTETALTWKKQIEMMELVDKKNLKIFFDTQNYKFFSGLDPCEELSKLYPFMDGQLHVKDGVDYPGGALLGEGKMEFGNQMKILKDFDYSGWIITENYYNQSPIRKGTKRSQMELLLNDIKTIRKQFSSRGVL